MNLKNLIILLIAIISNSFIFAKNSVVDPTPNIIVIMADDLGYGDLGCYGQDKIETPVLDEMARGGMQFRNFYAGCTVCASSRSVLMTGQHMGHTWVRGNAGADMSVQTLRSHDVTVA